MFEWVTTNDVSRETWRRLREFANLDIAEEAIARVHGAATSKTINNYKKQARQVRASILQAAEYFDAARSTSLFTRPNHLYYGLTSLASSMMLLLGDGTRSFDSLRKDGRNMRHGIGFTTAATSKTASLSLNLLEQSHISVEAHGHFLNWYTVLPVESPVAGSVRDLRGPGHSHRMTTIGTQSKPPFERISGSKHTIIDSMKYLPDLLPDLRRYGVSAAASRIDKEFVLGKDAMVASCAIHGASSPADLEAILERFLFNMTTIPNVKWTIVGTGGTLAIRIPNGQESGFQWPDSRVDMARNEWMYAAEVGIPEIVDLYLSAFGLSMLCRYYPDLWFSCLDSDCKAAQLVDAWTNVAVHKSPMLALSVLAGRIVAISTQRRPLDQ